ncbi:magnesium transporter CorA family protein [Flavilitoribacter nigricans]|uniref:Magnesium transporter CorA n=1 Tax=Flavilitoribacter nigricans (strain ATCC 23147 / DSM 23189 / NBRC 102662 / NCIMB 1420 / SS-2) TaxID=1122177 RepID=A0A2D0NGG0_FLAN2|nr:magnesium transporter CorA family protein [Flavilitoribacter nigricans]PHN07575.1 magnesium transporter CorA [Flavilitoribacter nigricans DSM 23189 = NBRC 102662]
MIRYYAKIEGRIQEMEEPKQANWINISPPFSQEELEEFAQIVDIPLDFLTDSLDIDERSRYEREDDIRLIVVNTPLLNAQEEEKDTIYITVPIGIIITPDHVITITAYENPVLQLFLDSKVKNFDPSQDASFVLQILEQNVYRFLTCLKKLNLQRNLIEQELYDSSRNRELKQLLSIEKSLVYFMNSLNANELLKMKMKRTDFLQIRDDEDRSDLFEDIIIDNSQALEMANVYTNILNGTMDAYGSIISNNLNLTIRRLTTITIILMVPTLIASFYGMNVPLPFENRMWTPWFIVIFSIFISLLLAWYFQRKRLF